MQYFPNEQSFHALAALPPPPRVMQKRVQGVMSTQQLVSTEERIIKQTLEMFKRMERRSEPHHPPRTTKKRQTGYKPSESDSSDFEDEDGLSTHSIWDDTQPALWGVFSFEGLSTFDLFKLRQLVHYTARDDSDVIETFQDFAHLKTLTDQFNLSSRRRLAVKTSPNTRSNSQQPPLPPPAAAAASLLQEPKQPLKLLGVRERELLENRYCEYFIQCKQVDHSKQRGKKMSRYRHQEEPLHESSQRVEKVKKRFLAAATEERSTTSRQLDSSTSTASKRACKTEEGEAAQQTSDGSCGSVTSQAIYYNNNDINPQIIASNSQKKQSTFPAFRITVGSNNCSLHNISKQSSTSLQILTPKSPQLNIKIPASSPVFPSFFSPQQQPHPQHSSSTSLSILKLIESIQPVIPPSSMSLAPPRRSMTKQQLYGAEKKKQFASATLIPNDSDESATAVTTNSVCSSSSRRKMVKNISIDVNEETFDACSRGGNSANPLRPLKKQVQRLPLTRLIEESAMNSKREQDFSPISEYYQEEIHRSTVCFKKPNKNSPFRILPPEEQQQQKLLSPTPRRSSSNTKEQLQATAASAMRGTPYLSPKQPSSLNVKGLLTPSVSSFNVTHSAMRRVHSNLVLKVETQPAQFNQTKMLKESPMLMKQGSSLVLPKLATPLSAQSRMMISDSLNSVSDPRGFTKAGNEQPRSFFSLQV